MDEITVSLAVQKLQEVCLNNNCDTCPYYKDIALGVCGCMINYPMDMEVPDDETL